MDDDDKKQSGQFDASFSLPRDNSHDNVNPAADLIRKKVEAAYTHEPDAQEEMEEVEYIKPTSRSKHQEFIYNLTNSGRPLHEINAAWHEYYAGLTDVEKHAVWQEFYGMHSHQAHHPAVSHTEPKPEPVKDIKRKVHSKVIKQTVGRRPKLKASAHTQSPSVRREAKPANPLHSVLFGISIGSITILIFLFGFFNERFIGPFIQPSRSLTNLPVIVANQGSSQTVSAAPEIIIPKINIEVPVVYGVNSTDDAVVQKALEIGVVHYADTALPGQNGNLVIVGHSAGNIFNPGQYKYVFSLLRKLENGDTFYLQKDSKMYTYQIYKKEIVKPTDIGVLAAQSESPATATLITCDPPGVSSNRLVVVGKQISPDPANNLQLASSGQIASTKTAIIPSDSPTLWSRLVNWFTQ